MRANHYICRVGDPTDILLMKVFASSFTENLVNFYVKRDRQMRSSPCIDMVHTLCMPLSYGCGVLFIFSDLVFQLFRVHRYPPNHSYIHFSKIGKVLQQKNTEGRNGEKKDREIASRP